MKYECGCGFRQNSFNQLARGWWDHKEHKGYMNMILHILFSKIYLWRQK